VVKKIVTNWFLIVLKQIFHYNHGCEIVRFFVSYIQIRQNCIFIGSVQTSRKIFEFKIVKVEISLTIAGSTISHYCIGNFALMAKIKLFWTKRLV